MFELFFEMGLTILIGFFALIFFEKTRISQVLILMLFGFLLGPVLHLVDAGPDSVIVSILPFVATLALIVLLFDAGLMIDIFSVARAIPRSTLFTFLVFIVSVGLVAVFSVAALGWPLLHGILLGAVAGGTSSAIVITMVEKTNIGKESKSLLTIESTITDALCIIAAALTIQLILAGETPGAGTIAGLLLSSFSFAIALGAVGAILWIAVSSRFSVSKYSYMLTLALVFGLYSVTEAVKGNGGFAVFVFGMILGNSKELGQLLRLGHKFKISPMIRLFQEEITFFVRTFFFVYLGLLLSPSYFNLEVLVLSLSLLVLFAFSRWLVQKITLGDFPEKDRKIVVAMLPRGLAAAVLASLPLASGISIPNFQQVVFGVILLSNIVATLGIFHYDRPDRKTAAGSGNELEEIIEESEAAVADEPPKGGAEHSSPDDGQTGEPNDASLPENVGEKEGGDDGGI
ncbi:MAG TPA: cation:proton antiporter [Candidatus Bilamarchaeum sp.]|nr:cation:proton antiporter [Candidatus Bilamarchaeum sp.]